MNAASQFPGAKRATALAAGLIIAAGAFAQFNPDPAIYDAKRNGASTQNGAIQPTGNNSPLGGSITVVNESNLPSLDIGIPGLEGMQGQGRRGGRGGPQISSSSSGGSSGLPIGGSSGGGGEQGQNSPFPMPPSQSQSQSQGQSQQGPMPPQSSQQQGGQPSQSGQMPQQQTQGGQQQDGLSDDMEMQRAQKQSDSQSSTGSPLSGQMPPPPPDQKIGDQAAQIDPNGELTPSEEEGGEQGGAGSMSESSQNKSKKKGQNIQGQQQSESSESDGQAMPEDMGGASGTKRGKGTVDDVAVPTNL